MPQRSVHFNKYRRRCSKPQIPNQRSTFRKMTGTVIRVARDLAVAMLLAIAIGVAARMTGMRHTLSRRA
jgi:hypothetical protein